MIHHLGARKLNEVAIPTKEKRRGGRVGGIATTLGQPRRARSEVAPREPFTLRSSAPKSLALDVKRASSQAKASYFTTMLHGSKYLLQP